MEITGDRKKELAEFPSRMQDELTILTYHGVTTATSKGIENYSKKHLPMAEFRAQMSYLKEHCHPLSIHEVCRLKLAGEPYPPLSVVVSFDDGFRNNLTVAAPILEELKIPAVFYICAGMINTSLMFWVDMVEDCINLTEKPRLQIRLDKPREFPLGTHDERVAALKEVKKYCKVSKKPEKDRIVREVSEETEVVPSVEHAENYRTMTWEEVKVLHNHPLFTIGGHSLYHDILASLTTEELERDIKTSLALLEYHLGLKITRFSYPEGQAHHYTPEVINILKKNGIVCSPSAIWGLNNREEDLFHLKRIMVGFEGEPFPYPPLT